MVDQPVALTIVTPTYNRCSEIGKLYESLRRQTCTDFQWLVIDDGSSDGTGEWFDELMMSGAADLSFAIEYHSKPNGGKHTALNFSHPFIKGRWMTIVDSDDWLTDDAVEVIVGKWRELEDDLSVGGVTFQRGGVGRDGAFDQSIKGEFLATYPEMVNRGMSGDHCETLRSDLFMRVMFPEYEGERFVGEAAMFYYAVSGYNVLYSDRVIYLCEYLEGGLTKSGRAMRIRNPRGGMWHAWPFMGGEFNLKLRLKNGLLYNAYSHFARCVGEVTSDQEREPVLLVTWVPGYLLYLLWERKYGR